MFDTLTLTTDPRGVATLTLNRPEKHNTLSAQMISDLTAAAAALGADPAVRVVVLAAAGDSFCAGGDLTWMKAQIDGGEAARRAGATALAQMLNALNTLPKPLIGRVHGAAYGGGLGMMSVCDLYRRRFGALWPDRNQAGPDPGHDLALCRGADRRGGGAAALPVGQAV